MGISLVLWFVVCNAINYAKTMLRTHTCGELGLGQVGQEVTLCGWNTKNKG